MSIYASRVQLDLKNKLNKEKIQQQKENRKKWKI